MNDVAKAQEKVYIYSQGMVHCSVCVPRAMPREEIERLVNELNPTGVGSKWSVADDPTFKHGQSNPCPCEKTPGRLHYLMVC